MAPTSDHGTLTCPTPRVVQPPHHGAEVQSDREPGAAVELHSPWVADGIEFDRTGRDDSGLHSKDGKEEV